MIEFREVSYNNEKRIAVIFKFNQILIDEIKKIQGRVWDKDNKYWHLPYVSNYEIFYSSLLSPNEKEINNGNNHIANTIRFIENKQLLNNMKSI